MWHQIPNDIGQKWYCTLPPASNCDTEHMRMCIIVYMPQLGASHWRVQDFPKMQKTPVQKVWTCYEVCMTQKNHQLGFSLSPRTTPLLQSWPVRAKKRRFWCTTLKIEILQKWSKFCQKSSFLGLLGRKNIKEGGGVGALCRISTKSEHRANFGGSKIDFEKYASTLI